MLIIILLVFAGITNKALANMSFFHGRGACKKCGRKMRVDEWYLPWNRAEGYVCERCSKCNYTVLLNYLTNNILKITLR